MTTIGDETKLHPMLIVAIIPLVVCVVGLLMYILATNPKVVELGRLTFFAGLLVFLFAIARETVKIST